MQLNGRWLAAVCLLAAGAISAFVWWRDSPLRPARAVVARAYDVGAQRLLEANRYYAASEGAAMPGTTASASSPSANPLIAVHAKLQNGLVAENPYAVVRELRAAKGLGSYAAAHFLLRECRQAHRNVLTAQREGLGTSSARRPLSWPMGLEGLPQEIEVQRVQAAQTLLARCQPLIDDPGMGEPLPDDGDGQAYLAAWKQQQESRPLSAESTRAVLVLMSQGIAIDNLSLIPLAIMGTFQGKSYEGEDAKLYQHAFRLASSLVTVDGDSSHQSLTSLQACLYGGICGVSNDPVKIYVGSYPAGFKRPPLEQVKELAGRIKQELVVGNVKAFMPN